MHHPARICRRAARAGRLAAALLALTAAPAARAQAPSWSWATSPGTGMAYGAVLDVAGDAIVTGSFSGTARFDTISLGNAFGSKGFADAFVAKYTAANELRWVARVGGENDDVALAITVDPQGGVYVAGDFNSPTVQLGDTTLRGRGDYDVFVGKLSAAGEWEWVTHLGGPGLDHCGGLATDGAGGLYVAGKFRDSMRVGATVLRSAGRGDLFVTKLDRYGRPQWARSAGGAADDAATDVAADRRGHVVVGGTYASPQLGLGTTKLTNRGPAERTSDGFVAALTPAGEWRWAKAVQGEGVESVDALALDSAGNAYAAGGSSSPVAAFDDLRRPNARDDFRDPVRTDDVFVGKLSPAGKWQWVTSLRGDRDEQVADLVADSAGTVRLTGAFDSPTLAAGSHQLARQPGRPAADAAERPGAVVPALYVAELSADGKWQWLVGAPGGSGGVAANRAGALLVTGYFPDSAATFGPARLTAPDDDGGLFIARLAPAGASPADRRRRGAGGTAEKK